MLLRFDKKKNKHSGDVSLTVFVSVPGAVMLFALVAMVVGGADWTVNVRIKDDGVIHCSGRRKKNEHSGDLSLTVFVSVPGAVVLFALVVMAAGGADWKANVRNRG